MKSYPGLPTAGCFIQTYIVLHDVHSITQYEPSTTVLAENIRITLSKESATKTPSNLEDVYLFCL